MDINELMEKILNISPAAQFEEDNDYQIVIYTNLTVGEDLQLMEME